MCDNGSDEVQELEGATELESALATVDSKLDETFERAERHAGQDDGGMELVLEQVLDLIYDQFGSVIPCDRIGVALVEDNGQIVRARWVRSEADNLTMGAGYAAPLDDDAVKATLESGEPLIVNDLEAYRSEHPDSAAARDIVEEGMRSSMTCPLSNRGRPTGMMVFSSMKPDAYGDKHASLFTHVAGHVSAILERALMCEQLIDLNFQLKIARDALAYQKSHDGLTRLLNRNAIFDTAEKELDRARRQDRPLTIVMCDLDHFKSINDTYGHLVGDDVLRAVSARLADALRSYESVGRYGGEEFLITLYDCDADDAPHAMERLRKAVGDDPVPTDAGDLTVTISLGAAVCGSDEEIELDDVVRVADEAMYAAKGAGRNRHETRVARAKEAQE